MPDYFVSADRGSDSTGAGTASSPWRTIAKAIGPGPAIALSGPTTLYVEPGVYLEGFTLGPTPTSTNTLRIVGDCDGAGFAAGGHATPRAGVVEWAAWSDDSTLRSVPCLAASSKSFVTLERIKFLGGQGFGGGLRGSCITVVGGTDWTLRDCICFPSERQVNANAAVSFVGEPTGGAMNHVVERCDLYSTPTFQGLCLEVSIYEQAAEYNANVAVRNCRIVPTSGNQGIGINLKIQGGAGGKLATGLLVEHCTVHGNNYGVQCYAGVTGKPLATPNVVRGCVIQNVLYGVLGGDATHVAEDYNVLNASTPRVNVSVGANSVANVRPSLDLGDGRLTGAPYRPFLEPIAGPLGTGRVPSGFPAVDLAGRPRPGGLGSTWAAAGALERGQCGRIATAVADGDAASLAIDGPGTHRLAVALAAGPNTLKVKARYTASHGSGTPPRVHLIACPEIGLAGAVAACTGPADAWEELTLPATTTKAGWTWVVFESRSASGAGAAYFDSYSRS